MRFALWLLAGAREARAELRRGEAVRWSGTVAYADAGELCTALTDLLAGDSLPERPVALHAELERSLAQVRTLRDLPPVSASRLKALVATQSGRFFRQNGKPLVTDAVWERGPRQGRVALAAAVEEPWVDAIAEAARTGGVSLGMMRPAGLPAGARVRLCSTAERMHDRQNERLVVRRLSLLAGAVWIAAAATLAGRRHATRSAIEREIARLDAPVAAMARAGQALDSASRMVQGLSHAESERARVLAALASISAALPDSAYVTALTLDAGGAGELSVVARRSAEVLAALEQAPGVVAPQLQGGIVREMAGAREWERFTVALGGATR